MKKFFLTAAAVSSLISSSVFADSASSSTDFEISVSPGLSWVLPFGDFMKSHPEASKSDGDSSSKNTTNSNSSSSPKSKNFSHSHFGNIKLMGRFAYKITERFSLGVNAGFAWQNFYVNPSLQDAFSVKYVNVLSNNNYTQHIAGWGDSKWFDDDATKGGRNGKGIGATSDTTAQGKNSGPSNYSGDDLKNSKDTVKKLYDIFTSDSNSLVTAKFSLSNLPVTVDATYNFVDTGSLKAFVKGFAGIAVYFPSSSLKIHAEEFKNKVSDMSTEDKEVFKKVFTRASTSTEKTENNNSAKPATAFTPDPMLKDVATNLSKILDGASDIKSMDLNVDFNASLGFVGGVAVGTNWDFGPMYAGADVNFSWQTSPSKFKVKDSKTNHLAEVSKAIKKDTECKVSSSFNNMFGLGANLIIGVSF